MPVDCSLIWEISHARLTGMSAIDCTSAADRMGRSVARHRLGRTTPQPVDLRLLRSFVVLSEELHFGRAASRLHVAQPALSQQIKRLEVQVGARLVNRTTRRVELTETGSVLASGLRSGLAELDTAIGLARATASAATHAVTLAGDADCIEEVRTVICAHRYAHPDHPVRTLIRTEEEIDEDLTRGRIDAALSWRLLTVGAARCTIVREAEVGAAVRRSSQLAAQASVRRDVLREHRSLTLDRHEAPRRYEAFAEILGPEMRPATVLPGWTQLGAQEELLHAVARGGGVALVTRTAFARTAVKDLVFLPLDPPAALPVWLAEARSTIAPLAELLPMITDGTARTSGDDAAGDDQGTNAR